MTQRPEDIFGGEERELEEDPLGRRERRPRVSDFVRRAIENTVGTVQDKGSTTREALEYLLRQGDKSRKEIFRVVASEVGDFLKHVDLAGEVVKILTSVEVEVKASVKFKPTQGALGVEPTPDSSVSVSLAQPDRALDRAEKPKESVPPPPPEEP